MTGRVPKARSFHHPANSISIIIAHLDGHATPAFPRPGRAEPSRLDPKRRLLPAAKRVASETIRWPLPIALESTHPLSYCFRLDPRYSKSADPPPVPLSVPHARW